MLSHPVLLALAAVVMAAAMTTLALVQTRGSTIASQDDERAAARAAFDRQLDERRVDLVAPAGNAEAAADMVRSGLAELVAGSDRDRDDVLHEVEGHVARLRGASADLVTAAGQPPPTRPAALPVAEADRAVAQLAALEDQAMTVATDLLSAADAAAEHAAVTHGLSRAAADFAATVDDLPDSDDPDELAEAWQAELDRLDPYREAVEEAAAVEGLAPLADVHGGIVDALTELAEGAVDDLEAGDVDGYNERLDDVLDRHDTDTVRDELTDAATDALEAGVFVRLQAGREEALELDAELHALSWDEGTAGSGHPSTRPSIERGVAPVSPAPR